MKYFYVEGNFEHHASMLLEFIYQLKPVSDSRAGITRRYERRNILPANNFDSRPIEATLETIKYVS